ncbi:YgiW/YdeI family stress tolerance OB fold protein [Photobacterium aphoticum]|uniref:Protein YgiW n=1 Tax=Photobacterium aphoticum TaxID=754436 RepID=A0A0J1GUA2_9GAMM|nr:NirD/YgiW/YdeI family stress tolerance protein [Photobacterium aphoticum]KLV03009.1 protein YgiW precursor [Photobacterium aphoticum]PSU57873.1 hypothetical protein C9I90_08350 [Photobacterium aphoticum]GHA60456.1 hypothetical protein GCM10007086_37830 [Photobacterium aphoticum]
MKKTLLGLSLLLVAGTSQAAFMGPGASTLHTVNHALMANEDTIVELTGHITQSLGDEMYLFKDSTGEIQIEIDNDHWLGLDVTPEDTVIIRGEVDSEWNTPQIDVDSIQKKA